MNFLRQTVKEVSVIRETDMRYYYKGHPYKVLGECKFKDPNTRQWHVAVMYQRADNAPNKDEIYVREKEEFYKRFIN